MQRIGKSGLLAAAFVACAAGNASASLITFGSRAAFDAVAPGLPIEDFEEAPDLAGPYAFPNPLDSNTSNVVFSPGDILSGLRIEATDTGDHANDLSFVTPTWGLGTSNVIAANFFVETLNLYFDNTNAVGMDMFNIFADPSNVTVSVFGSGDGLLGSFPVFTVNGGSGTFFGVINDSGLITRINLSSQNGGGEGVDNIAFGSAAAGPVVPEPATLLLLGTGLALARLRLRRQVRDPRSPI